MADMIEVIDALERCKPYCMCDDDGCPYYQTVGCIEVVRKDALELLKEYRAIANEEPFQCKDCEYYGNKHKCPCYETKYPILNFSCADGVRKNRKWLSD